MDHIALFYQWGDYDSLITHVPQLLEREDSLPASQVSALYQYLAIAQYAQGDSLAAKSFFLRAMEADTLYVLNPHYQSEASTLFFKSLKPPASGSGTLSAPGTASNPEAIDSTTKDSQITENETAGHLFQPPHDTSIEVASLDEPDHPQASSRFKRVMPYVFWGSSAAFAALAAFEYRQGEKNHQRLQEAADANDVDRYRDLQKTVKLNDQLTIAFAGASLGSLVAGLVWFWWPVSHPEQTALAPQFNLTYEHAGIRLLCQWPLD